MDPDCFRLHQCAFHYYVWKSDIIIALETCMQTAAFCGVSVWFIKWLQTEKTQKDYAFFDRKISWMNHIGSGIVTLRKCVIWRFPFVTTLVKHPTTVLLLHYGEICVRFLKPNVETKCAFPGWHDQVEVSAFLPCHLKCECSSWSGSGSGRGWLLLTQEWHRWKALQKLALWKDFWCNAKRSMGICFIIQIIINITVLMESRLHKGEFVTSWCRIPSCTICIVNLYLSGAQVHDIRYYTCSCSVITGELENRCDDWSR